MIHVLSVTSFYMDVLLLSFKLEQMPLILLYIRVCYVHCAQRYSQSHKIVDTVSSLATKSGNYIYIYIAKKNWKYTHKIFCFFSLHECFFSHLVFSIFFGCAVNYGAYCSLHPCNLCVYAHVCVFLCNMLLLFNRWPNTVHLSLKLELATKI